MTDCHKQYMEHTARQERLSVGGHSDGLCRFDGYEFSVFRSAEGDSNTISGKSNMHLMEDADGNIWIAHDRGISKYIIRDNRFINIYKYATIPKAEIFNRVLGQDAQGDVWIGVMSMGLFRIDSKTNKVIEIITSSDADMKDSHNWSAGYIDRQQRLWFTKYGAGLFRYDIAHRSFKKYLMGHQATAMVPIGSRGLLISSGDKLLIFDRNTEAYSEVDQRRWSDQLKIKNQIFNIACDQKGRMWLCNKDGAYVFDTAKIKVIKRFSSFSTSTNNYSYSHTAYCDHSGNMWIGTNGDGLKKLMNDTKGFRSYSTHVAGGTLVKGIYVKDSMLYVSCFDNGVDMFDLDTGFVRKIDSKKGPAARLIHNVYAMGDFNKDYSVLYSADPTGCNLALFNFRTNDILNLGSKLKRDITSKPTEGGGDQPFVVNTKKGPVLDWNSDLLLLAGTSPEDLKFELIHTFDKELLQGCYECGDGRLCVATTTGFYYQDAGRNWIKGALPGQRYVKTICEDTKGDMWVGTTAGIYVITRQNKLVAHYDVRSGLKNEFVYGILRDGKGRMWFSHNKGISVYDPVSNSFHHYSSEDGLQSNEFNTGAYRKLPDGSILFGGINGVNLFHPDSVRDNPCRPLVKITAIKVMDEPLRTDTACWAIHSLTVPYNKNSFTFSFTALEFTNPHRNQYAYKMDGLDDKWIMAGTDHIARYPALQPGVYTFKVKAANNDGVWQEEPATITITVVPPFWQQWWFRLLYVLAFIATLTGIILLIQRQRHRRQIRELELQQKIQLERERISRDLHDNVGTQLSLISNNIEWVAHPLKAISENEKSEKLQFVNDTARGIIATLRETIWALNKEQISLEEFSDKFKGFVQKQMALYPQTALNYTDQISEDVILGPSEALNLFRICQEAVANSLKYASATVLHVAVQGGQGAYKVNISDDGKGFDIKSVDPLVHNGLENMRYRASDIAGKLEIISEVGKGTRVIVSKS